MQRLKGETAYKLLQEFPPLRRNVTDEVVAAYIANQGRPGPEDFRVEHGDL